jgi:hypothetical protein
VLVTAVALGLCLSHLFLGWNHSIYDHHGFRQTQTALTTYYLLEGGPWLAYETPVLGAPWSIPMELPTYQLVTAGVVKLSGLPLDQAGRLVSVLCYLVTMSAVWALFAALGVGKVGRLVPVALMAVSPLLLFWSRTFMIESTAFALGTLYSLFVARYLLVSSTKTGGRASCLLLGSLFGMLTALTKVTTLVPFGLLAASFMLVQPGRRAAFNASSLRRYGTMVLAFAGLPAAAALAWVQYADHLKRLNPMANGFLTSDALRSWNFGTWEQKIDWSSWQHFLESTVSLTVGHYGLLAVLLLAFVVVPRHRALIALSLVSYLMTYVIFTNLYLVHDYYGCGSSVALIIAFSLVVVALLESAHRLWKAIGVALLVFLVAIFFVKYRLYYRPIVAHNDQFYEEVLGKEIQKITGSNDVVLIYGDDWSSGIAYGARRRALMDPWNLPLSDPKISAAIAATGRKAITAMVICGDKARDQQFVHERTDYFGLKSEGVAGGCTLFSKALRRPSS